MDLSNPILAGYSHMSEADLTPDPVPQRMGSGDHLNPQQFSDQLAVGRDEPTIPAVHQSPTTYYGEPQAEGDSR